MVTSTIPISPKPPNLEIVEQNHLVDTNLQIHRVFCFYGFYYVKYCFIMFTKHPLKIKDLNLHQSSH